MIYLHYCSIQSLLALENNQVVTTAQQRTRLRLYRENALRQHYPDLAIGQAPQGKPIAFRPQNLAFNHSHSAASYALAYSNTVQDLGVDIEEKTRRFKNIEAFAKRNLHPDELQMWQDIGKCPLFLLQIWTIKEAVLKAHGLGIRMQLHRLNTRAHPTWGFGVVEHEVLGHFYYQTFDLPHSILTVAYRQGEWQQLYFKVFNT